MNKKLSEQIKEGPSMVITAEKLGITRPTLYRLMENYENGQTDNMNKNVKEYFDKLVNGELADKDSIISYLENTSDLLKAEKESLEEKRREAHIAYRRASIYLEDNLEAMTKEEILQKKKEVNELRKTYFDLSRECHGNGGIRRMPRTAPKLEWIDDIVPTAGYANRTEGYVFIDASSESINRMELELIVMISDSEFPFARYRPVPGSRCFRFEVPNGAECRYRIILQKDDKVISTGSYDLEQLDRYAQEF